MAGPVAAGLVTLLSAGCAPGGPAQGAARAVTVETEAPPIGPSSEIRNAIAVDPTSVPPGGRPATADEQRAITDRITAVFMNFYAFAEEPDSDQLAATALDGLVDPFRTVQEQSIQIFRDQGYHTQADSGDEPSVVVDADHIYVQDAQGVATATSCQIDPSTLYAGGSDTASTKINEQPQLQVIYHELKLISGEWMVAHQEVMSSTTDVTGCAFGQP